MCLEESAPELITRVLAIAYAVDATVLLQLHDDLSNAFLSLHKLFLAKERADMLC